jgi:hypothetical protein
MAAAHVARFGRIAALLSALLLASAVVAPSVAAAGGSKEDKVRAFLDGKPIPLAEVGDHYCHDFNYPEIQCFSTPEGLDGTMASTEMATLTAGVTYVTIYDYTNYLGSYMHVSEDYWSLSSIGWNDRVSSFIGRNYESGSFHTDWFYGGTQWNFCCNSSVSDLGGYSNTFSSVRRT